MKLTAASKNLCEEFFQLTGIKPPLLWARSAYNGEWQVVPDTHYTVHEYADEPGAGQFYDYSPAYDLDFLFDLVPLRTTDIRDTFLFGRDTNNKGWSCVWRNIVSISDKPADAVIVLLMKAIRQEQFKIRGRLQ